MSKFTFWLEKITSEYKYLVIVSGLGAIISFIMGWSLVAALVFTIYLIIKFMVGLNKSPNVLPVMVLLGILQCFLIPAFLYTVMEHSEQATTEWHELKDTYLVYGMASVIALVLGFYLPIQPFRNAISDNVSTEFNIHSSFVPICFFLGIVSIIIRNYVPLGLNFLFYLLSSTLYISCAAAIWSQHKYTLPILCIALFVLFCSALNIKFLGIDLIITTVKGSAYEFVYWIGVFLIFYISRSKLNLYKKLAMVLVGFIFVFIVQVIKPSYRYYILEHNTSELTVSFGFEYFYDLILHRIPRHVRHLDKNGYMLDRLNQGQHIIRAMDHVPVKEPFALGETIYEAFMASLVPRLIWPDKPIAGGEDKYYRFTGKHQPKDTSYNLGPIGEAYINFGLIGGVIFLFCYGFFWRLSYQALILISKKHIPYLLYFFPFIFMAVIPVETDLLTVLNHFVKSVGIAIILCIIIVRIQVYLPLKT